MIPPDIIDRIADGFSALNAEVFQALTGADYAEGAGAAPPFEFRMDAPTVADLAAVLTEDAGLRTEFQSALAVVAAEPTTRGALLQAATLAGWLHWGILDLETTRAEEPDATARAGTERELGRLREELRRLREESGPAELTRRVNERAGRNLVDSLTLWALLMVLSEDPSLGEAFRQDVEIPG